MQIDPSSHNQCSTIDCQKKIQAACFTCEKLFCFNCSLIHAKAHQKHQVNQIDTSLSLIKQKCNALVQRLRKQQKIVQIQTSIKQKQTKLESQKSERSYDQRINPEKFQQQLNYISSMEKQTVKIVEKFFSELSLQLINIWENYLTKYSNPKQNIESLINKIEKFTQATKFPEQKLLHIHNFFKQNFEAAVNQSQKNVSMVQMNYEDIPLCPDIKIDEKMLISISQLLCTEVSTKNYQQRKSILKQGEFIHISAPDSLQKSVSFLPIFPICKQYCYLYNFIENTYEIQQFDKLQFLPAFPKSIVLWNGDIHLIGGCDLKEQVIKSHIVFRSSSAQVFKLSGLPLPRNPVNGLINKNKHIYMIGGLDQKKQWDNQCFIYSLQKKQWKQIASMNHPKPHQSTANFNNKIYCFGIPVPNNVNIQQYDITTNKWKQIKICNFLCNPFNFAAGFSALQINDDEILLFGGKKYVQNIKNKKRSTDRDITPYMYLYQPFNQSFLQVGAMNPCIGVSDGQINPIIKNGSIYAAEYLLSKTQPICRWLSAISILQIRREKAESIMILHED